MTPRQAQVALLSFAILAAGVAFNALVLQRKATGTAEATADKSPARTPTERGRKGVDASPAGRNNPRTSEIAREPSLRIARFAPIRPSRPMPEAAEDDATA
jgi:hypothetical protein